MPNYGDPGYWDQRYRDQEGTTFDWLEDYETIEPLIKQAIEKLLDEGNPLALEHIKILNLGCGNSILSEELYDRGFKNVYNIDISPVVIEQMSLRNSVKRPELKWEVMDVRNMRYPSNYFDLIIDKSTIDALLCGESSFLNTALMMKECQRILKPDAAYFSISYGTPENRALHYKRANLKFNVSTFKL